MLARIFCAIATRDFDGDARIWTRRMFLPNPEPLPDDGPIVACSEWCERFWPADDRPDSSVDHEAGAPAVRAVHGGDLAARAQAVDGQPGLRGA